MTGDFGISVKFQWSRGMFYWTPSAQVKSWGCYFHWLGLSIWLDYWRHGR